jgi:hypothetical protein
MRKIVLVLTAAAISLGIASANVHAASNRLKVTQIKVCLTSIGWCSDYMKRTPESISCVCEHHQQNPGRVTRRIGILPSVPQID